MSHGPSASPHLRTLQACRGLAALWVFFFHIGLLTQHALGINSYESIFRTGYLGVDFFFVLSGFIIMHVHGKDLGKPVEAPRYLLKRLTRIYPLAILANLGKLAFTFAMPSGDSADNLSPGRLIASFFLLPLYDMPLVERPFVQVMWSLSHELLFYFTFLVLILFSPRLTPIVLGGWLIGIVICHLNPAWDLDLAARFVFNSYNTEFILGCLAAYLCRKTWIQRIAPALVAAAICLFVTGLWNHDRFLMLGYHYNPFFWAPIFFMLVLAVGAIELRHRVPVPAPLRFLGDASYSLYLFHTSAQNALMAVGLRLGWLDHLGSQAWTLVVIVLSLSTSLIIYPLVERPMLNFFRERIRRVGREGSQHRKAPGAG